MSLFTPLKLSRTRYLLGEKHVPKGTPGAIKVVEESKFWYAYRREGKKQIRVKLFTDKAASGTKLAELNTALERGSAEMTDRRGRQRRTGVGRGVGRATGDPRRTQGLGPVRDVRPEGRVGLHRLGRQDAQGAALHQLSPSVARRFSRERDRRTWYHPND